MAIVVKCACGKALRTADAAAGRRVKCPGCGKVLTLPGQAVAKSGPGATTPTTRSSREKVPGPGIRQTDNSPAKQTAPTPRKKRLFGLRSVVGVAAVVLIAVGSAVFWYQNRPMPTLRVDTEDPVAVMPATQPGPDLISANPEVPRVQEPLKTVKPPDVPERNKESAKPQKVASSPERPPPAPGPVPANKADNADKSGTVASPATPLANGPVGEVHVFKGHTEEIVNAVFSPDGREVLSGSEDKTARLWDVASGKEIRRFEKHPETIQRVAFSANGKQVIAAGQGRIICFWDEKAGQELRRLTLENSLTSLVFSPDGRHALSHAPSLIRGRRVLDGTTAFDTDNDGLAHNVFAGSKTGTHLAIPVSTSYAMYLWDLDTGKLLSESSWHEGWIHQLAFAPDGRHILSGGYDLAIVVSNVDKNIKKAKRFAGFERPVSAFALAPDGKRLLIALSDIWTMQGALVIESHDKKRPRPDPILRVWDVAGHKEVRKLTGHADSITCTVFSTDGRRAMSGSADKSVRLWDLEAGKELHSFMGHTKRITSVAFSPDGHYALSASSDKTMRLWRLP